MDPLFTTSFPAPFEDQSYELSSFTQHNDIELQNIAQAISRNQFNPADYSKIVIAESGVPYYQTIRDTGGEEGRLLKVLMLNVEHWEDEGLLRVSEAIEELANHIRGRYMNDIPEAGFLKHKDVFHSNRDGKDTAFTTGLTLYNSWAVAPVSHSTVKHNAEGALWMQQFHIFLGKLAGRVMPLCMNEEYVDFCKQRKATFNVPCFGEEFDSQAFFTSSQINCSTGTLHVGGTAGGIHSDSQDCAASYSMSINLSVIRDSSDLGYFWFPNLDLMVPIRVKQIIIFQGIEEHTGTPMSIDRTDQSQFPLGYTEDMRFNVISYPKAAIINDTNPRNHDGLLGRALKNPNLLEDAQPHFGGKANYDQWRRIEVAKRIQEQFKGDLAGIGIKINMSMLFNSLQFSDCEGDETIYNSESIIFSDSLLVDDFRQRISLLQRLVNDHVRRPFQQQHLGSASSSSLNLADSLSGRTSNDQGGINYLLNEAQTNLERWPHPEVGETMSIVTTIDPQLLQDTSATDEDIIPELEENVNVSLTVNDFANAFSVIISKDSMKERKNAIELVGGKPFQLSKGIQGQLAILPPGRELLFKNPENMVDLCIAYGNAMNLFLKKDSEAIFIRQAVQASFVKLIAELLSVFSTRRLNVWDFAILPFETESFGLKLRDIIDVKVEEWRNTPATERILRISAKELLEDQYDSNFHLDVELDGRNRFRFNNLNDVKSRMLWQIMWGMCFHLPLIRFCNLHVIRKQKLPTMFLDRAGTTHHRGQRRIFSRFQLYLNIVQVLSQDMDVKDQDGLLMIPEIYQFAFGYSSGTIVSKEVQDRIILDMRREDRVPVMVDVQYLARLYQKIFPLEKLFVNRGSRPLQALYHQRSIAKRTIDVVDMSGDNGDNHGQDQNQSNTRTRRERHYMVGWQVYFSPPQQLIDRRSLVGWHIVSARRSQQKPMFDSITNVGLRKFMVQACHTDMQADKFIALRVQGPSFLVIRELYSESYDEIDNPAQFLYDLFAWWFLGFGRPLLIQDLKGSTFPADTMQRIKNYEMAVGTRITCIQAYGDMRIREDLRLSTLQKIHLLVPEFVRWRQQRSGRTPSFEATSAYIERLDIPYFRPGGLIHWLFICDLAEYKFCLPPTGLDLVRKLGGVPLRYSAKAKGGSGAIQAFEQIQREVNMTMTYKTSEELADALDTIARYLNEDMVEEVEQWVGRPLTMADMEHMLCKISREESRR